jgi:hypothetical protein
LTLGDAGFARFCSIAARSASELEYHLLLAEDLRLIQPENYAELAQRTIEVKRMVTALIQKLNADRGKLPSKRFQVSLIMSTLKFGTTAS